MDNQEKAFEFFKIHGIEFVKHLIAQNKDLSSKHFDTNGMYSFDGTPIVQGVDVLRKPFFDDLQRIVESWGLVEKNGGVEASYKFLWNPEIEHSKEFVIQLENAIADVKKVNAHGSMTYEQQMSKLTQHDMQMEERLAMFESSDFEREIEEAWQSRQAELDEKDKRIEEALSLIQAWSDQSYRDDAEQLINVDLVEALRGERD